MDETAAWEAARPRVDTALADIRRHADHAQVTYTKGPEHREQFLADLSEFESWVEAVRDALPAASSGEAG